MKVKQLIKILSSLDHEANLVVYDPANNGKDSFHYAIDGVNIVDAFTDDDADALYESKNGIVSFSTSKKSTTKYPVKVKQALKKLESGNPKSEVVINIYTSPTEETYHSIDAVDDLTDKSGLVSLKTHSAMKLQEIDTSSVYLSGLPF